MSPLFGESPICVGCPECGAAYGWACHGKGAPERDVVQTHQKRIDAYRSAYPWTPRSPRFVQICSNSLEGAGDDSELMALDEAGDVWIYYTGHGWKRLVMDRPEGES